LGLADLVEEELDVLPEHVGYDYAIRAIDATRAAAYTRTIFGFRIQP